MESKINIESKDGVYIIYLNHMYKRDALEEMEGYYAGLINKAIESKCLVVDYRVNRVEHIPPIKIFNNQKP